MHDPRQPRRSGHARLHDVPLKPHMHPARQRLLVAAGVGFSTLVIVALYAASYPYQVASFGQTSADQPRWSVLKEDVMTSLKTLQEQRTAVSDVKQSLDAALSAQATQAESISIMKAKIESSSTTQKN